MGNEKKVVQRKNEAPPSKTENNHNKSGNEEKKDKISKPDNETSKFRYGPMPSFPHQRIWTRAVLIVAVLVVVWLTNKGPKELKLAVQRDLHKNRGQTIECDRDFLEEVREYENCSPKQCGRYILDTLVTAKEADILLNLAKRGMAVGRPSGGATILDLHTGAVSHGTKFVSIYALGKGKDVMTPTDLTIYKIVRSKIQRAIASNFEISTKALHLTYPTFFSRMTNKAPKTEHDEYWHRHVDKETYESFHYTSLLYLSDYGIDFLGGRFIFLSDADLSERNITVEPRKGRVLMFTSGGENPHLVEPVTTGERYAITVSFTCNSTKAIADPSVH